MGISHFRQAPSASPWRSRPAFSSLRLWRTSMLRSVPPSRAGRVSFAWMCTRQRRLRLRPQALAPLPRRALSLILRTLATRQTLAAHRLTTSSPETSIMTSSTRASLSRLASPPGAPSATQRQASTAPRTARLTASSAGASLVACPAPYPHRRPLPHARVSLPDQLPLASLSQFEKEYTTHFLCTFADPVDFQHFFFERHM